MERHKFFLQTTSCLNTADIVISSFEAKEDLPCHLYVGGNLHYNVTATTLGGGWRREELYIIARRLKCQFDNDQVNYLAVGGVKGSETTGSSDPNWLTDIKAKNPLIEGFGAGSPAFIAGSIYIGHMTSVAPIARHEVERRGGVRRPPHGDQRFDKSILANQSDAQAMAVLNSERSILARAIEQIKPSKRGARPKDFDEVAEDVYKRTERKYARVEDMTARHDEIVAIAGAVSPNTVFSGPAPIPMRTPMEHCISLESMSAVGCGLFVEAMHQHSLRRVPIGGHARRGAGGFIKAEYTVQAFDGDDWIEDGQFSIEPGIGLRFSETSGKSQLRACLRAWHEADMSLYDFNIPEPPR